MECGLCNQFDSTDIVHVEYISDVPKHKRRILFPGHQVLGINDRQSIGIPGITPVKNDQ